MLPIWISVIFCRLKIGQKTNRKEMIIPGLDADLSPFAFVPTVIIKEFEEIPNNLLYISQVTYLYHKMLWNDIRTNAQFTYIHA